MAGTMLSNIIALALLLPAALALPFDVYDQDARPGLIERQYIGYTSGWEYTAGTAYPWGGGSYIATATGTCTGTGTGTGYSYAEPTDNSYYKREIETAAKRKRHAFEGPRHQDFPNYYPSISNWGYGPAPTAAPTGYPTGTAPSGGYPTAPYPTASGYSFQPYPTYAR